MATIVTKWSRRWKAVIRKMGWPPQSRKFRKKRDAEGWERRIAATSPRFRDSALKSFVYAAPLLVFLGCGSGGTGSIMNPPPVHAQTTYSNASLSGAYSLEITFSSEETGGAMSTVGTMQFDGNGNVTGAFQFPVPGQPANDPRQYTLTGTYSVSNPASGTAALSFQLSGGNENLGFVPFLPTTPLTFSLVAAQQGASVILTESDDLETVPVSVIAFKQ